MDTPLPFVPAKRRVRRKRSRKGVVPGAGAPVLIAAEYETYLWVRLTFDRPVIGPGSMAVGAVVVDDGPGSGAKWACAAVTVLGPARLELALAEYGPSSGMAVTLTANAETGIVSASDGTAWAGVTDLVLPYPASEG